MASPSSFSFESLGSEIDHFISEVGNYAANHIPEGEEIKTSIRTVIPRLPGDLSVDLVETETEFIITCDLPGVSKENVTIRLQNQITLFIKAAVPGALVAETAEADAGAEDAVTVKAAPIYHIHERKLRTRERTIQLPSEATAEGAKATFINGIMELVLQKTVPEEGTVISIE